MKATAHPLKRLKAAFPEGVISKFAKDGLFCYWETAFHYLSQGHSKTAKEVNKIGADAVVKQTKQEVTNVIKTQQEEEHLHAWDKPCTEQLLQDVIIEVASYGKPKWTQELVVANKRLDLISVTPRLVTVVELKTAQVTLDNVLDKLEYRSLVEAKYGRKVKLVFASPCGISNEGANKIAALKFHGHAVEFVYYAEFLGTLLREVINYQEAQGHWYIKQRLSNASNKLPATAAPFELTESI